MERVAFLVEETGERIPCLLNPESVIVRRRAGVRVRDAAVGPLTYPGLRDDPLLYTGGGSTEFQLDLVFDVSLLPAVPTVQSNTVEGAAAPMEDIRERTRRLMKLAEGGEAGENYTRPPLVRFLWGKSWNVLGVITAVAERLESFTTEGVPQRSWMRLRMLRVDEARDRRESAEAPETTVPVLDDTLVLPPGVVREHQVMAGGPDNDSPTERTDQIAYKFYERPELWRLVAQFNNLEDPTRVPPGTVLRIPPASARRRQS